MQLSFSLPPSINAPTGDKAKVRDILTAIRTLKQIVRDQRPATDAERQDLACFGGFGAVALSIFPDPVSGKYKDGWREIGEELKSLLSPEEYASARRTTFNAFYTSPTVIHAMHQALSRLGVSPGASVLEPGCANGRFITPRYRFIGVELDSISGHIARTIHPQADIRIENFRDTKLPQLDAVIGNVPFADVKMEHNGHRFSLHDYFFAKSVDALKPGGILALVTSHFTLDKQNATIREYIADRADFLGAIRLPSDAFKREGTSVVTDIVFLRKRDKDEVCKHCDPEWIQTAPLCIEGADIAVNKYFLNHPEMVLGTWSRRDTLYGEGYSVTGNGDLAVQLREAVGRLPEFAPMKVSAPPQPTSPVTPPSENHITEGSFFVGQDRIIRQMLGGQAEAVVYGGSKLWAGGALLGRRLGDLIGLRDKARRVLRSQNEGWPEAMRVEARRDLNWAYERFTSAYGPINKTTFGETKDGTTIRRMPNLVKFREDPDAMLVMSLEDYDEVTGKAKKAAIMLKDVVGKNPPVTHVNSAEEGLLVSLNQRGAVDLAFIAELYGKPEEAIIAELGDLIYLDPESKAWQTADAYLSGNVRAKLAAAELAGATRNADALRKVQPEDVLPGDIDANLGAPWIPEGDVQAFATDLFQASANSIQVGHLKKDALWSVSADYAAMHSVPATSDYGTPRINGTTLLELALNMKTPVIYDPDPSDPDKRVVNHEATLAAKEKQKLVKEKFRAWVFSDPDRTERLVRVYNDTYNNLRPRIFDGSHLDFPGMNQTVKLNKHQVDAVWRCMSGGNTLLAHCVGAGKSFEMAAAAMKMKQAGLIHKPLITVPNHLLEQFGREWMQLYPNAKLLIASKEDMTRERRKYLTAKIASGDWDGIIVTHSSFERIGMSQDYQEKFLEEQIAEYDHLLLEHAAAKGANRNLLKTIEKQKAAREEKLKDLLAEDKKDDGLVFDEVGVDHLFVDECFTYDTLVETDRGSLKIGDIVTKHLRVSVKSVNTLTRAVEWKPVVNWFANKRRHQLVEVVHEKGSIRCTAHHKLFTGFVTHREAGKIKAGETLLALPEAIPSRQQMFGQELAEVLLGGVPDKGQDTHDNLRFVQDCVLLPHHRSSQSDEETPTLLLRKLQNAGTASQSGVGSQISEGNAAVLGYEYNVVEGDAFAAQGEETSRVGKEDERKAAFVGNAGEAIAHHEGDESQALTPRRQWSPERSAGAPCREDRDDHGVGHQHQGHSALNGTASEALQSRPCRYITDAGDRSGWQQPSQAASQRTGCQEGQGPIPSRVVRVEILQPGSDGEYRFGGRSHQVVYDIEVADNHNYFANGVLVSNCQAFKNLETPTKMDRVAGIQSGGSERAFDLFMKARYLHEKHPGHGLVGASGTPISNSIVEMYTMQRLFDPAGLCSRGIDHFDAWAATFGEVVDTMEISPDGKTLKPRSRFSKFVNLPELQMMFRSFADVQTAPMLDLPCPKLEGGKPYIVACPMSDEQADLQMELVARYERIRSQKVDPREDNALAITTDGRKLALDARMLSANAADNPESKISALVENVVSVWQRTAPTRSTQMIFCDMGVNPTPWGYSAYDEVIRKLIAHGIPRNEIAAIGKADSDAKKKSLFDKVRNGQIRVLIGSTQKMGTGTNVQKRLVALHHLDAPWKPAEVEQREGRILRQGNENEEVAIYRYVTEGSFDAYMWQALETKARFISQIMSGESGVRRAEDIGGQELSYAKVKAIASGNPAVLTLAETDAELQRLAVMKRNHLDEQFTARRRVRDLPEQIRQTTARLTGITADSATLKAHADDPVTIGSRPVADPVAALGERLDALPLVAQTRKIPLGIYRGLHFGMVLHPQYRPEVYLEGQITRQDTLSREHHGPRAVLNAVERLAGGYNVEGVRVRQDLAMMEGQLRDYQARLGQPFPHERYLTELTALRRPAQGGSVW